MTNRAPRAACLTICSVLALTACSGGEKEPAEAHEGAGGQAGVGGGAFATATSSGTGPSTCVAEAIEAELRPLDIYLMLDQSGSMVGDYDQSQYGSCSEAAKAGGIEPNTRWADVTAAIESFVLSPDAAGIGVGLGFFPPKGPQMPGESKCDEGKCDVALYATPSVDVTELPGAAAAIQGALEFTPCPCNGTPMSAALQGATAYAAKRATEHPDRMVAVVLATDGEPKGECSGGADDTSGYAAPVEVAKQAFETSGIPTYVIGVGKLPSLHAIAAAGGTDSAFLVDASQGTEQAFVDALNTIRKLAIPCDLALPAAPDGQPLDPAKVNVEYTAAPGADAETIANVVDASGCEGAPAGWYYDDPASPSAIVLCPQTCDALRGTLESRIDVAFGCATVVAVPS